jgi:hypothetical protein
MGHASNELVDRNHAPAMARPNVAGGDPVPTGGRRPRRLSRQRSVWLGLAAVATFATGCASGAVQSADTPLTSAGVEGGSGDEIGRLPDVVVNDVGAGTEVSLQTLVPSEQPILLWFWAPH